MLGEPCQAGSRGAQQLGIGRQPAALHAAVGSNSQGEVHTWSAIVDAVDLGLVEHQHVVPQAVDGQGLACSLPLASHLAPGLPVAHFQVGKRLDAQHLFQIHCKAEKEI